MKGEINYFEKPAGSEIDFILDRSTSFEVKETCTYVDLRSLSARSRALNLNNHHLIGRTISGSGFDEFIWGGNIFENDIKIPGSPTDPLQRPFRSGNLVISCRRMVSILQKLREINPERLFYSERQIPPGSVLP